MQFWNKYVVRYDIVNKELKQGNLTAQDVSDPNLESIPYSVLIDANPNYLDADNQIKAVPVSYLKVRELKFRNTRWTKGSFATEDASGSNREIDHLLTVNESQGDLNAYYEISNLGTEPSIRAKDRLNNDFIFQLNIHFDEIMKYEVSSKIQIDELFLYLGALFGFMALSQKLIIYFYVRPKFEQHIASHVSSVREFKQRTNLLELYRVHRHCEHKGNMDF